MSEPASRTDELRALISLLGLSQRQAAEALEVDTRDMRYWCAANPEPPLIAIYAMRHLAASGFGRVPTPATP
jgi:hypothetical protein